MRNTNYKNFIKRLLLVFSASLVPAGVLTYIVSIINPYSVPYTFYIVLFIGIVGVIIKLFQNYILNYNKK
jgi:FtsH-binding integral membrane protein